jgi:thioredoxin
LEISDRNFPGEVLNFSGPTLVFMWAPWCGHCRKLFPVIDQVASFHLGSLKVAKIELEPNPATASRYQIQGVPALLFFKSGKLVDKVIGALPREEIEKRLRTIL